MKRNYTDSEKEKILGYINDELNETDNLGSKIKDSFSDFFSNLFNVHISANDYLDDMDEYYKKVIDCENIAIDELNTAFKEVERVDSEFGQKFIDLNNTLKRHIISINKLQSCIYASNLQYPIEQPIFISNSDYDNMLSEIPSILPSLINEHLTKYATVDASGNITSYNWNAIADFMIRDTNTVSKIEYYTMLKIVDSFTMLNGNDNPVINTDDFAKFISCSYIKTVDSNSLLTKEVPQKSTSQSFAFTSKKVTISPIFQKISLMLNESKENLINNYSYSLYDSTENASLCYTLKNEISKSDIMNYISNNMPTLYYDSNKCLTNSKFDISLNFGVNEGGNYYCINSSIEDSGILNSANIYEFNTNLVNSTNKNLIDSLSDMQISSTSELPVNLTIAGLSAITSAVLPGASAAVFAASEVVASETLTAIDITNANNDYDQLKKSTKNGYYTSALFVGGSASFSGSSVTYNNLYIDRHSLEIAVDAYMDNRFNGQYDVDVNTYPDITTDALIEDFNTFLSTGVESKELAAYAEWIYSNDGSYIDNKALVDNSLSDSMYYHNIEEIKNILSNTKLKN